ncbi:hypothetical protein [Mesorhizobium sp. M0460]|uniref:hypothetical protein n=1 Tax=unclassified Mesorhizobium TaxID=325217 RepID=UPI00333E11D7
MASSSASRSTNWLKAKCYSIDEYELLGVEREAGKPAFALMAERGTGRYVGSAFVTLNREMRERLWKRVQEHPGAAPQGHEAAGDAWVKPGIIRRVKHLRGEEDPRHASLHDFREDENANSAKGDWAGISYNASEIALFGRAFDKLRLDDQSPEARDGLASRIIANYMAGVVDEAELVSLSKQPLGR